MLVLRLQGPMQSWGLRARWDIRDTGTEPSKSAIVGMLGCALGYHRNDKRLEEELDKSLSIGVRIDYPGVIARDFQTVSGLHLNAEGKQVPKTIVSPRSYIFDASFTVVIEGPKQLLERCHDALLNPCWPIFLGRKSCPPIRPVVENLTTEFKTIQEALEKLPRETPVKESVRPEKLRCVIETVDSDATRQDALRINPMRIYSHRRVKIDFVSNPELKTGSGD